MTLLLLRAIVWISSFLSVVSGFSVGPSIIVNHHSTTVLSAEDTENASSSGKKDNKAMAFLRKIGKVGGSSSQFTAAMGVDEGPAGVTSSEGEMKPIRKAKSAYQECTVSGVIDDMSETFPFTSSGTEWAAYTDQVMGGVSSGSIAREDVQGKTALVLRGKVSLANNGGFVQMVTNLALNPAVCETVDASAYDGIEVDALVRGKEDDDNSFNIHLKNDACLRQFSSYRATFSLPQDVWTTVRLPWSQFQGKGPGADSAPFDLTNLRRMGIVAIGREIEVNLAISSVRFYKDD